ncbi:uncharacterized protein BXIN_1694 [Babesia sp. Xinjiang]|uniref:uncharacterized protein n=1 Tax=Babesia sp. Xinjiang TaxID=462227 RepID=UPI000A2372E9|nr:uncharacterized protein BXIN_1694 [Babesia sp. Xinjiang]ORM40962.1 hypothetical protein BXIN_1694 [Babesia sp. Xinjiang]
MALLCLINTIVLGWMTMLCTCSPTPAKNNLGRVFDAMAKESAIDYGNVGLREVTLKPTDIANFICGPSKRKQHGGVFTLYPSDPLTKTLMPLTGGDFEDAVTKEVLLRDLFRSVDLRIDYNMDQDEDADVFVRIEYPINAVLMARDPSNFSLNYACKYQPDDKRLPPIYRWFRIAFKNVYPMAYGFDTGNNMLFKNSAPRELQSTNVVGPSFYTVFVEPGMIVGIYCQAGERLEPSNCFDKDEIAKMGDDIVPYIEQPVGLINAQARDVTSRLRVFKVGETAKKTILRSCSCVRPDGNRKVVRFAYRVGEMYLNSAETVLTPPVKRKGVRFVLSLMQVGTRSITDLPNDGWVDLGQLGKVGTRLAPENPELNTFNASPMGPNQAVAIKNALGLRGVHFSMEKIKNGRRHIVDCAEDALIICKNEVKLIYYDWVLKRLFGEFHVDTNLRVLYHIVPTDPYTYGCGVDSEDLFQKSGFQLSTGANNDGVTECKVNPYVTSPVGFYCPKGYTLEPANCFEQMTRVGDNKEVSLSDYADHARPVEGKYIKAVDFQFSEMMSHLIKYTDEELMCRCVDQYGKVRAAITLDLRQPIDTQQVEEAPAAVAPAS